jgi:hypothetical protein
MHLSPSEKQALVGPAVVGSLLGVFVAYAVFAFASEYELQGIATSWAQTMLEAVLGFLLAALATIGVLGLLPVAVHRMLSNRNNKS